MRANYIHLEPEVGAVLAAGVPGDLAELGVWWGTTFMPLAELARAGGRRAHAVDSFHGMARPTDRDRGQYREGVLSVHGSAMFREVASEYIRAGVVVVHEGWVPRVLDEMTDCRFAVVHLDLDQYAPTLAALDWLFSRLNLGGVIMVHDARRADCDLAGGAVADWLRTRPEVIPRFLSSRHVVIQSGVR